MNPTTSTPTTSWSPNLAAKLTGNEQDVPGLGSVQVQIELTKEYNTIPQEKLEQIVSDVMNYDANSTEKRVQQLCDEIYNVIVAHDLRYAVEDALIHNLIQRIRDRRAGILEQTLDEIAELKDKVQVVTKHIDVFNGLLNQMAP